MGIPGVRRSAVAGIAWTATLLLSLSSQPALAEFFDPDAPRPMEEYAPKQSDADYDPLDGMDQNGRIPTVRRPSQVTHPSRWRYLPEGRLKPGNILQRFLVSSFITPYAFSSSDVGVGFGLAITDLDFRGTRRREFASALLSYTSEGQQNYELKWRRWLNHIDLAEGGILQEERSLVAVELGYLRALTLRFYGLGSDTTDDAETSYSDRMIFADMGMDRSLFDPGADWVAQAGVRFESHQLSEGHVEDRPSTEEDFPALFASAQSQNMGWLRLGLRYDTRDSQEDPYQGWHVDGLVNAALVQTDGDVGARFTLTAGKVLPVFPLFHHGGDAREENPPTDTLALGFWNEYAVGELPFYSLPMLGGPERHRGFISGRFYGRASWLAAAEYRFWVFPRGFAFTRSIRLERIGLAGFYEVGAVADGASALFSAQVRHSYGISLRLSFERTAPFRFDLGFSQGNMEFAVGYGLTF